MKVIRYTFVLAALCLTADAVRAQTAFGINAQYGLDVEEFQIGAELHVPIRAVNGLSFVPNVEFYLRDDPTIFNLNADFHWSIGSAYTRSFTPYVGAGLALTRWSNGDNSETEPGINLIGGFNFRTSGSAMPFFQVEYRATDPIDDLSIGGGVRFRM